MGFLVIKLVKRQGIISGFIDKKIKINIIWFSLQFCEGYWSTLSMSLLLSYVFYQSFPSFSQINTRWEVKPFLSSARFWQELYAFNSCLANQRVCEKEQSDVFNLSSIPN